MSQAHCCLLRPCVVRRQGVATSTDAMANTRSWLSLLSPYVHQTLSYTVNCYYIQVQHTAAGATRESPSTHGRQHPGNQLVAESPAEVCAHLKKTHSIQPRKQAWTKILNTILLVISIALQMGESCAVCAGGTSAAATGARASKMT